MAVLQLLEHTGSLVEGVDQLIQILGLRVDGVPGVLRVVPQGVELLDVPGLLFHPGVVLEVVDPLAVHIAASWAL